MSHPSFPTQQTGNTSYLFGQSVLSLLFLETSLFCYILTYLDPTKGCYWSIGSSSTDLPHNFFLFLVIWASLFSWAPAMITFSSTAIRSFFFFVLLSETLLHFICSPKPSYLFVLQIPDSYATHHVQQQMYLQQFSKLSHSLNLHPFVVLFPFYTNSQSQHPLRDKLFHLSSTCSDTPEFFT